MSAYELLLDSLDLGRHQRLKVWNWRQTDWQDIGRHDVLPTEDDTLLLLKKPGIGFCPAFQDLIEFDGKAALLPEEVKARAIDIIAE